MTGGTKSWRIPEIIPTPRKIILRTALRMILRMEPLRTARGILRKTALRTILRMILRTATTAALRTARETAPRIQTTISKGAGRLLAPVHKKSR